MKEWADRLRGWAPPEEWHQVVTVDAQVAEVSRSVWSWVDTPKLGCYTGLSRVTSDVRE